MTVLARLSVLLLFPLLRFGSCCCSGSVFLGVVVCVFDSGLVFCVVIAWFCLGVFVVCSVMLLCAFLFCFCVFLVCVVVFCSVSCNRIVVVLCVAFPFCFVFVSVACV